MFIGGVQTTRELIAFLSGECCSVEHLHGDDLDGFTAYVCRRFNRHPICGWPDVLWEELGNKPLDEGCEEVLGLLRDWFSSRGADIAATTGNEECGRK
jgi:hypothetical protein